MSNQGQPITETSRTQDSSDLKSAGVKPEQISDSAVALYLEARKFEASLDLTHFGFEMSERRAA